MKSYNVKSNAKRFARGIAAKHPEYLEAIEPVETAEGSREWFPAVGFIGEATDGFRASIFDSYSADVIVHAWTPSTHGVPVEDKEGAVELGEPVDLMQKRSASLFGGFPVEAVDASGLKAMFDEVPPVGDVDGFSVSVDATEEDVARGELPGTVTADAESAAKAIEAGLSDFIGKPFNEETATAMTDRVVALAAAIPPTPKRSREEIEASRAARRERVAKEKEAGIRSASGERVKPEKISKKKTILDLVKRKGGATQAELEAATGWQRHTLRGYIAGTLRKQLQPLGLEIECIRGKGEEPTRYRIPMMDAARAEGGAA